MTVVGRYQGNVCRAIMPPVIKTLLSLSGDQGRIQ